MKRCQHSTCHHPADWSINLPGAEKERAVFTCTDHLPEMKLAFPAWTGAGHVVERLR